MLKARTQSTTTSPQIAVVPFTNTEMNHVAGRPDTLLRATSVPVMSSFSLGDSDLASSDEDNEGKVDKVYTIGCFDLFHRGHVNLLRNMRKHGREASLASSLGFSSSLPSPILDESADWKPGDEAKICARVACD